MKWAVLILLILLAYGHFNKRYFNQIDLEVGHFAYSALANDALMKEVKRDMDLAETRLGGMVHARDSALVHKQWDEGRRLLLEVDSSLLSVQEDIRDWEGVMLGYESLQQLSKQNLEQAQKLFKYTEVKKYKLAQDYWEDTLLPDMLRFKLQQYAFAHNVQHQAVKQVLDTKTRVEKASYMGRWISMAIVFILFAVGIYFVIQVVSSLRKMREIV